MKTKTTKRLLASTKVISSITVLITIMCFSFTQVNAQTVIGWEFNSDDEGWNRIPTRCSSEWNSAGYLDITTTGENDPGIRNIDVQGFSGANANFLELRVLNGTADTLGQIIFFLSNGTARSAPYTMTANSSDFETLVVDLSTVNNYSNDLDFFDIRIDANATGAAGVISFDYIRLTTTNSTLGLESQELINSTTVYPNPVIQGENIFINLEQFTSNKAFKLSINDLTGKLIYTKEVLGGKSELISTNDITAGVYLVSLQNENSLKRFKVIVN